MRYAFFIRLFFYTTYEKSVALWFAVNKLDVGCYACQKNYFICQSEFGVSTYPITC